MPSGRVTVNNHYASAAERTQVLDFGHGEGLNFLSLKDRRRLLEALEKATGGEGWRFRRSTRRTR